MNDQNDIESLRQEEVYPKRKGYVSEDVSFVRPEQSASQLRERIDNTQDLQDIKIYLSGTETMWVEGNRTTYRVAEPRANELGTNSIVNFVQSFANKSTVQAAIQREQHNLLARHYYRVMSRMLAKNYVKWGIDPTDRTEILDSLFPYIYIFCTRMIGGGDRRAISGSKEYFRQETKPVMANPSRWNMMR